MKRFLTSVLTFLILVCSVTNGSAQRKTKEYEPTINWPYLLDDFYYGTIVLNTDTVSKTRMNFHLRSEGLYCIDKSGKVARVVFPNMQCVIIKNQVYRFVDNKPMLQVYAESDALLMDYQFIDYDLMDNSYMEGLALYAKQTSDNNMTMHLNPHFNYKTIHMRGEFNESYAEMRNNWYDGKELPMKQHYYFVVRDKAIHATLSECNKLLDKEAQKRLKDLIKARKLKWKNKDNLTVILQFMKAELQ